jgi:23S rRNA pseudouridine955/2504/2580 synthase
MTETTTLTMSQQEPVLLAQQDNVWVFIKPSGMAVHPTNDPSIPDLMTWAEAQSFGQFSPIHRLDRETSGIVLCSPDAAVRGEMGAWFARGEVEKRYRALVYGATRKRGTIKKSLFDRRRRKALEAETEYERLGVYAGFSYLDVAPHTGRKHQIRQHLQGIGHAIVGDRRYRPRKFRAVPGFPDRLWLHAYSLTLPNGWSFEAPLPHELERHLQVLQELDLVSTEP